MGSSLRLANNGAQNKNKNMAKKATPSIETAAPTKTRDKVLKQYTPSELRELIGADTKIGVSLKELKLIVLKAKTAEILAEAGL